MFLLLVLARASALRSCMAMTWEMNDLVPHSRHPHELFRLKSAMDSKSPEAEAEPLRTGAFSLSP